MIELGLKLTLAYLIGSILGSLVVGRIAGGVDIRQLGSGNAGGTNALRTRGKVFAFWVLLIDVIKGVIAAVLIPDLVIPGVDIDPTIPRELVLYGVGMAAVAGHVFPIWFGFRGGKGGATAAGLLVFYSPILGVVILVVWLGVIIATGFVGLATMCAAVGAASFIALTRLSENPGLFGFACLAAVLIVYTHRSNIQRMAAGTESRLLRGRKQ